MSQPYEIADLLIGGNTINVTATVEDDGSLTIFDLSFGPSADAFYGAGRDVEVWLTIPPDAVNRLAECLFGQLVDNPADKAARHLAANYQGDSSAYRKIEAFLDQNNIQYESAMWT